MKRPFVFGATPSYPRALLTNWRKAGKPLGDALLSELQPDGEQPRCGRAGAQGRRWQDSSDCWARHWTRLHSRSPRGGAGPARGAGRSGSPSHAGCAGQGAPGGRRVLGLSQFSLQRRLSRFWLAVTWWPIEQKGWTLLGSPARRGSGAFHDCRCHGRGAPRATAGGLAGGLGFPAGTEEEERRKAGHRGTSSRPGRDPRSARKPPRVRPPST